VVPPVGIDDLNVYTGTLTIDFSEIAAARKISQKNLDLVQFVRRSVVPNYEDPVTLAVNAAKPIVAAAGRDEFGLLILATETGTDYGKPLSSYAQKYLRLSHSCRNFEIKHACYAGTAALQMAVSWVRSGVMPGKKALVLMTDIARRHFDGTSELTIGDGAVALSIAANPRIVEIEPHSGCAAREVYDVARPAPTLEWVDPVLSLASYLDLLELAWDEYSGILGSISVENHFAYMLYHTPLVSLVEQAHQILVDASRPYVAESHRTTSFERMVRPALRYTREIGNIYSGNLYVALAGLLESTANLKPGTRVGFFSYGSGACAEVFSGLVCAEARTTITRHRIGQRLAGRRRLKLVEYEAAVLATEQCLSAPDYAPSRNTPQRHFQEAYLDKNLLVLESVIDHYRHYAWS
jgi:3-hydroxy-3-methylglutaryl CoA synthase